MRHKAQGARHKEWSIRAQLASSFESYAFDVIRSERFAFNCCKRYKIAPGKPLPQILLYDLNDFYDF
jgi:hypothetical protein